MTKKYNLLYSERVIDFFKKHFSQKYTCKKYNTMEKRNLSSTVTQKEVMITALEANYGNVTKAAKLAQINPKTHYRWMKEDSNYEREAQSIKDLGFRNIKDDLIELGMKKAEQGDSVVLNKMLSIFLKDLPEEMKDLNRYNNVPFKVGIKYVDNPRDQPGYIRPGSSGKE